MAEQSTGLSQHCSVDGCYRETRGGYIAQFCEKHGKIMRATGHIRPQKRRYDWVSDAAGPECRVCGRSVYEHGVTEFCLFVAQQRTA